jgi:hypothetical protein
VSCIRLAAMRKLGRVSRPGRAVPCSVGFHLPSGAVVQGTAAKKDMVTVCGPTYFSSGKQVGVTLHRSEVLNQMSGLSISLS